MIQYDEVTFKTVLNPYCPNCGSNIIVADKNTQPFYGDKYKTFLVVPFCCEKCRYSFSINIEFNIETWMSFKEQIK